MSIIGAFAKTARLTTRISGGLTTDNSGRNSAFSISPARVTGRRYIELNRSAALRVEMMLGGMGAAAKEGCANAANAASRRLKSWLIKTAAADMTCGLEHVRRAISITAEAAVDDPAAAVRIKDQAIPLIEFSAHETDAGVDAMSLRSQGFISHPDAFIETMPDGREGIFEREGAARLPIDELEGPSVADALRDREGQIERRAEGYLIDELQAETDRIFNDDFGAGTFGATEQFIFKYL